MNHTVCLYYNLSYRVYQDIIIIQLIKSKLDSNTDYSNYDGNFMMTKRFFMIVTKRIFKNFLKIFIHRIKI